MPLTQNGIKKREFFRLHNSHCVLNVQGEDHEDQMKNILEIFFANYGEISSWAVKEDNPMSYGVTMNNETQFNVSIFTTVESGQIVVEFRRMSDGMYSLYCAFREFMQEHTSSESVSEEVKTDA